MVADVGADTAVDEMVGFGGGGIAPLGGPYCIIGLTVELAGGAGLGSLTAYMVASSRWGSTVMVM